MNALINNHGAKLCYITSDYNDPIQHRNSPDITTFYFNALFPFVLPFLDAKVVVMTMPDLNQFHVRRSINDTNHVYVFHSLVSTHMVYRLGAFDHYDTVFCAGPHHLEEVRRTEEVYGLKPKCLLEVGYYRVEKIFADHKDYLRESASEANPRKCVLIAPSWQDSNILETYGSKLIATLLDAGYDVVFRPHPMTIAKKPDQLLALEQEFGFHENFRLDTETVSEKFIHEADVLVCDWSGVALEYAFGTERPVLFIDLPRKVRNPEYEKLEIEPVEVLLRDQIGRVIGVDDVSNAAVTVSDFLAHRELYRDKIVRARERYVYNFGKSSDIGAKYIMDIYGDRISSST
jgi:YidC/Oxa1 family membrane protein insertase